MDQESNDTSSNIFVMCNHGRLIYVHKAAKAMWDTADEPFKIIKRGTHVCLKLLCAL